MSNRIVFGCAVGGQAVFRGISRRKFLSNLSALLPGLRDSFFASVATFGNALVSVAKRRVPEAGATVGPTKDTQQDQACRPNDASTPNCIAPSPKIKHVIVLMLENRSFDHMLGYSKIPGVDGLWDKDYSNVWDGETVRANSNAASVLDLVDPGHDYADVQTQLYFPQNNANQQPTMGGFVESYATVVSDPRGIMSCYKPEDVPVITTLAREFAVCDRWFSSLPGPTLPNRLFAHAGTSKGRLDLSAEEFDISPTIYEVLDQYNVASTIYADGWSATATFWALMKHQDQYFGTLDDFYQDCYDNNLPGYCFLEPRYSSGLVDGVFRPQNDQHPDSDITEGENLIYQVYSAIRANKAVWESSVLVIVYDEHGGLCDHHPPPEAVPPADGPSCDPPFNFDRYGVRVPAVIVSAYTHKVVCHETYDHTSLIATARKLLTGCWRDNRLGNRAMCANTFDSVFNVQTPRHDPIAFAPARAKYPEGLAVHEEKKAKRKGLNDLQVKHLKQAFLLDTRLNLRVKESSEFKDLSVSDPKDKFQNFTPEETEHYIQQVLGSARQTKRRRASPLKTRECPEPSRG